MIAIFQILILVLLMQVETNGFNFGDKLDLKDLGETEFFDLSDYKIEGNRVYVADVASTKVYLFDSEGNLIHSSGRAGRGPGEFLHGPRQITPYKDKIYVKGFNLPYFFIYDSHLNFITNEELERELFQVSFIKKVDDKLLLVTDRTWENNLVFYDPDEQSLEGVELDFEIVPGLLYRYNAFLVGNRWLFAWYNRNKFRVYDPEFKEFNQFSILNLPEKAEGVYVDDPVLPPNPSDRQREIQQAGAFAPRGSFFEEFVVLDDHHFMVQLGHQTGGSDRALILNLEGEIVQEITLPESGPLLTYSDGILYMQDSDLMHVVAYEFLRGD